MTLHTSVSVIPILFISYADSSNVPLSLPTNMKKLLMNFGGNEAFRDNAQTIRYNS